MAFDLTFSFRGPCVYIPIGESAGKAEAFVVLLPDASDPQGDDALQIHIPVMVFPEQALTNQQQVRDRYLPFQRTPGAPREGAVLLMRREIVLPEPGPSELLVIQRTGRATQGSGLQEKPVDPSSFDWMPRLEDVDPKLGPIDPAALNNAAPPPATVASRLVAKSGTVWTEQISLDKNSRPRKWIFPRPPNVGVSNFLGLGVGIRQRVAASSVALTIRSFDRPSESFELELGSQNSLQIRISNLEPSRIFGSQPRATHLKTDNDFRYLYRLSADQSVVTPDLQIPRLNSGGINDGSETCGGSVGKDGGGSP